MPNFARYTTAANSGDVTGMLQSMFDAVPQAPAPQAPVVPPSLPADPKDSHLSRPQTQIPSISQYGVSSQTTPDGRQKAPYSETLGEDVEKALDPENLVKSHFVNLHEKTPEERADIGSKFGGGLGLATNGWNGALIGAGVGAMVARAMGKIQTGEHENSIRRDKVFNTFNTLGLSSPNGVMKWDDGSNFVLTNSPSARLANTDSTVSGKKDRAIYDIDPSHPMTRRTMAVARPLAYYVTHGLMGWRNPKNKQDGAALDQTTGLLVNALQSKATNVTQIYGRAQNIVKKLGVPESHMRTFFDSLKSSVGDVDAANIRRGLDILYAPQGKK